MISFRDNSISILPGFLLTMLITLSFPSCKKEHEKVMNVSNDSILEISNTSAKAFATIIDIGDGIDQHGHCWSADAEPTIVENENKTENGTVNNTGSYSSRMTGLIPNTKYYVRAYVKKSSTTVYGDKVLFFNTLSIGKPVVSTGTATAVTSAITSNRSRNSRTKLS